ncbi:MAG: DUF2807 domain-containing protein [Bacteroidales bacterium]|nr:DUF2807 domain-containing protein [Bacteroidales bacterium]
MKTSNKMLLGALLILLSGTVIVIIRIRQYVVTDTLTLSGVTTEKTVNISVLDNLTISGALDIKVVTSNKNSLLLSGDSTLLGNVKVEDKNNGLAIKLNGLKNNNHNVTGTIYTTSLQPERIELSSGAFLSTSDTLKPDKLNLVLYSGSQANVFVKCKTLNCEAFAGARAELSGGASDFTTKAFAGANIDAVNLLTENTIAEASAGAHITVNVTGSLDANCSASGSVRYSGSPEMKNISVGSGGNLSKIE